MERKNRVSVTEQLHPQCVVISSRQDERLMKALPVPGVCVCACEADSDCYLHLSPLPYHK